MDNALIDESNYLRKDELDTTKYKFRPDYIPFLYDNCLHENKIPLKYFAACISAFSHLRLMTLGFLNHLTNVMRILLESVRRNL